MRRWFFFSLALVASCLADAAEDWSQGWDGEVASSYVRRGIERAGPSIAPEVWLKNDNWTLRAWAALPAERASRTELGASAGYSYTWDSGAKIEFALAKFHFGGAVSGQPAQTTEATAALSFSVGPGRLRVGYTRDLQRRADIGEVAFAGEYALKRWGAFLNYRFYAGTIAADDVLPEGSTLKVADAYSYYGLDLTLPYRVGGQWVLTPGLHGAGTEGARPFWSPNSAAPGGKIWASLSVSYEF